MDLIVGKFSEPFAEFLPYVQVEQQNVDAWWYYPLLYEDFQFIHKSEPFSS
jgi:hypothetical protein